MRVHQYLRYQDGVHMMHPLRVSEAASPPQERVCRGVEGRPPLQGQTQGEKFRLDADNYYRGLPWEDFPDGTWQLVIPEQNWPEVQRRAAAAEAKAGSAAAGSGEKRAEEPVEAAAEVRNGRRTPGWLSRTSDFS